MPNKDVPFDQFYSAVGRGITSWALVEDGLRDLFTRLIVCSITGTMGKMAPSTMWVLGNVFYSSTNLRARLTMLGETMDRLVADPGLLQEWKVIERKVLKLYKRRNMLAHGAVWGNGDDASHISGPMFALKREHYPFNEVAACDLSFRMLAKRTTDLAISVNKYLVANWRTSQKHEVTDSVSE